MSRRAVGRTPLVFALAGTFGLSLPALAARRKGKKKEVPRGTPVLWRDPGNVSALDLLHGAADGRAGEGRSAARGYARGSSGAVA